MSERLPCLLVAHDETGSAAIELIQSRRGSEGVVSTRAGQLEPNDLAPLMANLGTGDPFVVVHLVGALVDPMLDSDADRAESVLADAKQIHTVISETFPQLERVYAWIIHAAGQEVDDPEQELLSSALDHLDLRGVLVTAAATRSAAGHPLSEQVGFCADAAEMLFATGLESQLAQASPRVWAVGSASASYRASEIRRCVTALVASKAVEDRVLAEPRGVARGHDLGGGFIESLELTSGSREDAAASEGGIGETERTRMLAAQLGGSLLARFRSLGINFDAEPLRDWMELITTSFELKIRNELPEVEEAIEQNRRRRARQLTEMISAEVRQEFATSASVNYSLQYCEGLVNEIEIVTTALGKQRRSSHRRDIDADLDRLRSRLKSLPFGAAAAIRILALALLVLFATTQITTDDVAGVFSIASYPWARFAAIVVLIAGYAMYQRRLVRTIRLRDSVVAHLEQHLVDTVETMVVDARIRTNEELIAHVGAEPPWWQEGPFPTPRPASADSLADWLALFGASATDALVGLKAAAERTSSPIKSSRWHVDLPDPADLSTEDIIDTYVDDVPSTREVARKLIIEVLPDFDRQAVPVESEVQRRWSSWGHAGFADQLWTDLGSLLSSSRLSRRRVRELLENDLTPSVDAGLIPSSARPRHYLAAPGGEDGVVRRSLFEPDHEPIPARITTQLTATMPVSTSGVVAMLHLVELSVAAADDDASEHPEP